MRDVPEFVASSLHVEDMANGYFKIVYYMDGRVCCSVTIPVTGLTRSIAVAGAMLAGKIATAADAVQAAAMMLH